MSRLHYRPDVDGLRAAAVIGVILFHAGLPQFRGGFAGVDIFFVISGYLITSLLFLELDRTGRIDFVTFWARRTRRILPSALLVVVATLAAAYVLAPHLEFYYAARDAIYAALYVINWQQLAASLDYFDDASNGLFVHYWSLAVEEQFYLFLTIVFAVALSWGRVVRGKMRWTAGQAAAALLLFLGFASFVANLVLTPQAQPVAFFGTHARIWELSLGAGVALLQRRGWSPRPLVRSGLAWLGTAAIALTFLRFNAQVIAYPGIYATLPTIGTAFYILAGINAESETLPIPLRLGSSPIPVAIGKLSYALYLWHWPLFELYQTYFNHWTALDIGIAIGATVLLAIASHGLVENPIRFNKWLGSRPRPSLGGAVAVTLFIVLVALTLGSQAGAQYVMLPSGVVYDLSKVRDAYTTVRADKCHLSFTQKEYGPCVYGRRASTRRVFLTGDSHALHWFSAVLGVANDQGFALYVRTKSSCSTVPISVISSKLGRIYHECDEWRERVLNEIERVKPELVLVGLISNYRPLRPGTEQPLAGEQRLAALVEAERKMIARIAATGARIGLFADTPWLPEDPLECLSKRPAAHCRWPADKVLSHDGFPWSLQGGRPSPGVSVLDFSDQLCWDGFCRAANDRFIMMRDVHHIASAFSASLSQILAERLAPLLSTPAGNEVNSPNAAPARSPN